MKVEERKRLPMFGVDEALEMILEPVREMPVEEIPLAEVEGRYLAREIRASSDMPPFDRTAMDGYAVRSADVASVPVDLEVIEEIPAGRDPAREVGPRQASRIMTGAAVPAGADAIVMVESTELLEGGGQVRILEPSPPGLHIRRAGEDLAKGAVVLGPGAQIGPAETALLAAEGCSLVPVRALPSVAILSTGDELVPVEATPRGSQIRETNSWLLRSLLSRLGIEPRLLGTARDEEKDLSGKIRDGLRANLLLVSGGVSMGELDLVGGCLKSAGCRAVLERVAIKPGKPLFFGHVEETGTLVFGLPGNPVSSFVDFLVFARPALLKMMGERNPVGRMPTAILSEPVRRRPGRRGYLPARVDLDPRGALEATPLRSMGSADLMALSRANALLVAPEDQSEIPRGAAVRVLLLEPPAGD